MSAAKIIYTHTDEAPMLATASLLPIIRTFAAPADVVIETADISLAGRIVANFSEYLDESQRIPDALAQLGELALEPEANIIKLPNISASLTQLKAAIAELQEQGYGLPDFPEDPTTPEEHDIRARYDRVRGSAVNPVLREGNSDRRAPKAVKQYAQANPHSMGTWSPNCKSHVSTMSGGDFFHNELSTTLENAGELTIEFLSADGETTTLRKSIPITAGEIVDATKMERAALEEFLAEQISEAKDMGLLFSLHMKATMMKVSDPIIFGHAVRIFFADVFERFESELTQAGANPNQGLGQVLSAAASLPGEVSGTVLAAFDEALQSGPQLAMVNSDRGITNLHVPSDVIIDASMPAMIRASGQMWNSAGDQQDTKAVIPDSSYAGIYAATIDFCRVNGAFDPTTMGTVPNVGLMAKKAEEYGSHDKTFEIPAAGTVRVLDESGSLLFEHRVDAGDIWRMCQVQDSAVQDWVKLAVSRARATGAPAVFWLDDQRPHDAQVIAKVEKYLQDHDTDGLTIKILSPVEATNFTLKRVVAGEDTISVTGNVLRDYLTDLFPILELGTSAKMLSIVPLMNGGGLFETGAGGSAPKHVEQLLNENHLRWDSLGEFLALAVSLEHLAEVSGNAKARILSETLDIATGRVLSEGKSPRRKVNELDNRGSHFYLALFWAQALVSQTESPELAAHFTKLAEQLAANEDLIVEELSIVQGHPVRIGGYYAPDEHLIAVSMRPSATFNHILGG